MTQIISNLPNSTTIVVLRATTLTFSLTLTDDDGSPISLVGNTITLEVFRPPGLLVLTVQSPSGIVISTNTATVTITAAQSQTLAPGDYTYRVLRDASGVVTPILTGDFRVRQATQ